MGENDKPLICIVDDDVDHSQSISTFLQMQDFRVALFSSATDFLARSPNINPYDLVISDLNMPGVSGLDLCRILRANHEPVRMPIILITGSDASIERAHGVEAGADEFIGKPFSTRLLLAKIRSLLSIRAKATASLQQLESSQGLNAELQKFLSPNLVSRLSTDGQQGFLQPHRAEVTVLFSDLRRFTAFSEKAEPEEVLEVLRQYYTAVGTAAMKYKGTLGHLAGDGIMVFFNDPEPVEDHQCVAIKMALEAREMLLQQKKRWDKRRYDIDFGMGLSEGFATIGGIGFDRFSQYSVIGGVANFASRLCHVAVEGQILISHRYLSRLKIKNCQVAAIGEMKLKGIEKPVSIYNILSMPELLKKSA